MGPDYCQKAFIIDDSITKAIELRIYTRQAPETIFREGDFIYIEKALFNKKYINSNRRTDVIKICNLYEEQDGREMSKEDYKRLISIKQNFMQNDDEIGEFISFNDLDDEMSYSFIGQLQYINREIENAVVLHFVDFSVNKADELNVGYLLSWEVDGDITKNLEIDSFYLIDNVNVFNADKKLFNIPSKCDFKCLKLKESDFRLSIINSRVKHNKHKALAKNFCKTSRNI